VGFVHGEGVSGTTCCRHYIEVPFVAKGNLRAVWADAGVADPAGLVLGLQVEAKQAEATGNEGEGQERIFHRTKIGAD